MELTPKNSTASETCLKVKVAQLCLTLRNPNSTWNSPGQNNRVGSLSLLQGDLPNPGIELRSPALKADSLPVEPQGKPPKTGDLKPAPSPVDLPKPGIPLGSPALQADSLPTELSGKPKTCLGINKFQLLIKHIHCV